LCPLCRPETEFGNDGKGDPKDSDGYNPPETPKDRGKSNRNLVESLLMKKV
jgi:hypothetical protein